MFYMNILATGERPIKKNKKCVIVLTMQDSYEQNSSG